jgi:diguanylate cyclase (GGDEF)-like protein/PAS domain S-box-containing protein
MIVVTAVRACDMQRHARARPSPTVEAARRRETRFVVGAVTFMGVLSMWTLIAFAVTDDSFVRFTAITVTIPYAFGMWTRSFAIDRGTNLQALVAFVPLSAAMLIAGGWYPWMIVAGFVPLFIFIKSSSNKLKAIFHAELAAQTQSAMLAERLDSALNNMSHGLCMIDAGGRLILANDQFRAIFGLPPDVALAGEGIGDLFGRLIEPRLIPNSDYAHAVRALFRGRRIASDLTVPIETRDGRAIEATVRRMADRGTVLVIQDVTERRNAEIRINRMAHFDAVTELPNRHSFEIALASALDPERPPRRTLTVMFLDLDNFKQVNDSLGHRTGDKLLREIARRLRLIVGPRDVVGRWGGDEFVILHCNDADEPTTPELASRIIEAIGKPVVIDGSEVIVGVSIGAASAPDDGLTAEALLSNADIALYAAKADGRRNWRAFEPAMDTRIQVRRLIELELRAAVANDAIDVHFQPILDVATRRIVSFEALARWRHPVRGPVSPAEFIPIVEEIGLMEDFGAAVLRRACAACAAWPANVGVSVNLSPSQFRSRKIETVVAEALKFAGLPPHRLDLEITESILLDDRGDTRGALSALRARGCRISLDDFGTGYSSLSYLLSFPLDRIKIDRSFTMGLGVQERASIVVECVAAMSRKLGMTVLIEGVETERQMRVIEQLGAITEAQGFLFSPPVPLSDVGALFGRALSRAAA